MSCMIGQKAPDFLAPAVLGDNSIVESFKLSDLRGSYVLLFFYPLDFTFVCPTEIIEFDRKLEDFRERGCEVVGVSVDSHFSHFAWKDTPREKGGVGSIRFPLVSDLAKQISRDYGVLTSDGTVALRGAFLIDRDGVVRHMVVNDLPLGRNIDEALRMLDALQHFEAHGEVCPAGWVKGKEAMKGTQEGVSAYLAKYGQ